MLRKEDIIAINKQFDKGIVVNQTSLEYTISSLKNTKSWLRQVVNLTRAILIDHIFEEGNKRTAATLIMVYFEANKIAYDSYKLDKIIAKIVKKNITSIKDIEVLIKSVTR